MFTCVFVLAYKKQFAHVMKIWVHLLIKKKQVSRELLSF